MVRAGLLVLAVAAALVGGHRATAQQDGNGNGLYEVCIWGWGHMGEETYLPYEVTLEQLEEIAANSHTMPYQGNADGTCPPRDHAYSLEIAYCVWGPLVEDGQEEGATGSGWLREWHSLPYFIQDFQTNSANIAPLEEDGGCPTEPPGGSNAPDSA